MNDKIKAEMISPELRIIGIVHSDINSLDEAPKGYSESNRSGTLEISAEFEAGLEGIEAGQTVVVLFWLHRSARDILKVHPRGDRKRPLRGVFSTRSPVRPNPIGISELEVVAVNGNRIQVRKLDMLDQTPIIDIKKKI